MINKHIKDRIKEIKECVSLLPDSSTMPMGNKLATQEILTEILDILGDLTCERCARVDKKNAKLQKDRYHSDPLYRERAIARSKKYAKKKRELNKIITK